MNLVNWGIAIVVTIVVIWIGSVIAFDNAPMPNNHTWTNEQYHHLDAPISPFTAFIPFIAVAILGSIILAIMYLMIPEKEQTFDPPV